MNDFFIIMDWLVSALLTVVLSFLVAKFWECRWSLFFGDKQSLGTIESNELHSCFISAFNVTAFYFVGSRVTQYVTALEIEEYKVIGFFYFSMVCVSMAFAVSMITMHYIRKCTFSPTARQCLYLTLLMCVLQTIQYVFHAMNGNLSFTLIYQFGVMGINLVTLGVVAKYPIKAALEFGLGKGKV